jgi:hypothetical protein
MHDSERSEQNYTSYVYWILPDRPADPGSTSYVNLSGIKRDRGILFFVDLWI